MESVTLTFIYAIREIWYCLEVFTIHALIQYTILLLIKTYKHILLCIIQKYYNINYIPIIQYIFNNIET